MLTRSFKLFTLFGFEVRLDLSWLILGFLITWSLAQGVFPHYYHGLDSTTYWLMGVAGAIGLFFSIVLHEFSHSVVARKNGLPMKSITLFIFGGVAQMTDEPSSPMVEFKMAIAGPIASVVLGVFFYAIYNVGESVMWSADVIGTLHYLAIINFILAAFNLVPAFPLDGGRVLRALLWKWKNNIRWATKIASHIGSAFAFALMIYGGLNVLVGDFVGGVWYLLIGMFLQNISKSSYQQLIIRQIMEGQSIRTFMNSHPVTVAPDITIDELVDKYVYIHHFKMFPIVSDANTLIGCISLTQIKEIPRDQWKSHTVTTYAASCSERNTINADEDAVTALSRMNKIRVSRLMVVDNENHLVGIISLKDLMKLLSLKMDLEE